MARKARDESQEPVYIAAIGAGTASDPYVDETAVVALEATTPTEYNITLTVANTEYSQVLPPNTRRLCFRCRGNSATIRYAWATGKVAGPAANYQSLQPGADYILDGVKLASKTLYFASVSAGATVEMESWA